MPVKTNTDHVIIDLSTHKCVCKHCGGTHQITLPMPISKLGIATKAFIALHKDCQAKGEPQ